MLWRALEHKEPLPEARGNMLDTAYKTSFTFAAMALPLEDNFEDILGKAQRGLQFSDSALAEAAGISEDAVRSLKSGKVSEPDLKKVALPLGLNPGALVAIARKEYRPAPVAIDGLAIFTTPFNDITVNACLVWDPQTRDTAAFDTGADITEMLDAIGQKKLHVRFIFLTHTHGDHVFELDRLKEKARAPAYVSRQEAMPGAEAFEPGRKFEIGSLSVETRLTSGHSRGGITYFIQGLARPVAIVGDSLFAGSMGGGMVSYEDALRNNREKVLTLPDETVLCPGHGPLTSVAEEKKRNPFFA